MVASNTTKTKTWSKYMSYGYSRHLGTESVLFTGPDGVRDYKTKVEKEHRYIGEGTMSPEGSSGAEYLWRSPGFTPFPKPRSLRVGEIGWGVHLQNSWFFTAKKDAKILLGEFRQAAEDRHTHLYQNPWYSAMNSTKRRHNFNRGTKSDGSFTKADGIRINTSGTDAKEPSATLVDC